MQKKSTQFLVAIALLLSLNGYAQTLNRVNGKKTIAYRGSYQRVKTSISANHGFEIREGTLWAWGNNNLGQLGDGTTTNRPTPVQIGADDKWVSVSAGSNHGLGLKSDGTLWSWGNNVGGQLGIPDAFPHLTPTQVGTSTDWASIVAGSGYSMALKTDGTMWAFGTNNNGAMGLGYSAPGANIVQANSDNDWVSIDGGGTFTMAVKSNGTLWACGDNTFGQIGDGTTTNRPLLVQVGTDNKWTNVVTGATFTIGLKSDGTLWAWGNNNFGQLGDGTTTSRPTPVQIGTDNKWVSISSGSAHTLGLKSDGTMWVWGINSQGQLGDGTIVNKTSPIQVGSGWVSVMAGITFSFGIKSDGSMWSWGNNNLNQLGNGNTVNQTTPLQISRVLNTWLSVSAGGTHSLAVKTNGTLWAWGQNNFGQVGDGTNTNQTVQTQIGSDNHWVAVNAGQDHSLALKSDGTLWAWGNNGYGQLGDGTTADKTGPVQVGSDNKWVSIGGAVEHSVGLKSDGTLWAWGHNNVGQLGDGSTADHISPVQIGTGNDWVSIAIGGFHNLALKSDGTLWAWGSNSNGQLGDGTTTDRFTPVQIGTGKWVSVAAHFYHSLGLKSGSTLWAWGNNGYGQLGDGSTIDRPTPVQIGTSTWVSLATGFYHSHAIRFDGRLYGWGKNDLGELGDGTNTNRPSPTVIGTIYWIKTAAGNGHSLGIKAARDQVCATGYNAFGQMGYGGTTTNANAFLCTNLAAACSGVVGTASPITPTNCQNNPTGSAVITLTGTGTLLPGTYTLDAGASLAYTTNPFTVSGLASGTHTIVATTSGFCTSAAIPVNVPSGVLTNSVTTTPVSCGASPDGTATITLSTPGTGTYSFDFDPPHPFTTNPFTITGLPAGSYYIHDTITATGCFTYSLLTIAATKTVTGSVSTTGVTCLGASNGTATVTLGGTAPVLAPGTYTLEDNIVHSYTTNPFTITGLKTGSHSLYFTTAGSCTPANNIAFSIASSASQVSLSIVPTAVSCRGTNSDGSATVTLSGSGASSSGTWKITVGSTTVFTGSFSTNPFTITGLGGISYNLTVTTTLNSCVSASTAFTVPAPAYGVLNFTTTPASCAGVSDATVTVTAPAGYVLPLTYSFGLGISGTSNTNPFTVTGLAGHSYAVSTSSAIGCEATGTAFVGTNAVTGSGTTTAVTCTGGSNGTATITLTSTAATTPGTYKVDGGASQPYTINPFTITGLTAGNHTIVATVTSSACSAPAISVTVGTNPAVTATWTTTMPACFNGNDGTATITLTGTAAGAPGTYTLDGGTSQPFTTNPFTITGLTSGFHNVIATVTAGPCTSAQIRVDVGFPSPYAGTATTTTVHCYSNNNDGTATITLTGAGAGPSGTYSIDGGSNQHFPFTTNPFTVTGLTGGNHQVYAFLNPSGCIAIIPITVPAENMVVTAVLTGTSCAGANDGSATLTISGIAAPSPGIYQVDNGPSIPYTTNPFTITGLSPGSHKFYIGTSVFNCPYEINNAIITTQALTVTHTEIPISCAANADGSTTLTFGGFDAGNSGTYTLDGGSSQPFSTNPFTITGLAAGTHIVTATFTGSGSCISNININIPTALLTGLGLPTPVSCVGVDNGTASVLLSGSGSLAPGTYTLDGGSPHAYTTNPFNITGLSAGNHTVVATSGGTGCVSTNIDFTVPTSDPFTGSGTTTAASCFGGTNGTATITLSGASGSLAPGTYTVDGGSSQSYSTNPFTITGLTGGNHTIIATTSGGCTSSSISVTVATGGFTGSGTTTTADCLSNNNGTATITLSGGNASAPGTYTVDGGTSQSYSTNPFTITGLGSGSHTIVATVTGISCSSSPIVISVGVKVITGSGTTTPVSCAGNTDGTATITLTGAGSAALGTYTVDGGTSHAYSTNPFTITGLGTGNHTIVATTATGPCTSDAIIVNVGSASFTVSYTKNNVSACNGVNDGSITVTPTGPGAPFTYSWTGSNGFTAGNVSTVSNLPFGYYNVTVTNASACGVVTISNIHIESAFYVYITNSGGTSSSCGNTGSIILYGNAGVQPYTYSLNGTTYQVSNTFINLAAGNYTGYVKDAAGCISQKAIAVGAVPGITVSPVVKAATSCSNDGSIEIYRTGGIPPYTYSIDNITYVTNNKFLNLAAGNYITYVKDAMGCVGTQPVTITQGVGLTVTASKQNSSTCINDGLIQVNASGGTAPYTYSLDGTTFQLSPVFTGLGAGNYTATVKDFKGCLGTVNVSITLNSITVTAYPRAAANCSQNTGKIEVYRTGGVSPYTYSINGISYQASSVFTDLAHGTYQAYVKDAQGCIGTLAGIVVGPLGCRTIYTNNDNLDINGKRYLKVTAFPNPSSTEFTVMLDGVSGKERVSINIKDVQGRNVYQSEKIGKQFTVGKNLIAGVYILEVIDGTDKVSIKLIKQ